MSEGMPLSAAPGQIPVLVTLGQVFEAHVVEIEGASDAVANARLSAPVGATLMAALDWMAGGSTRRGFRARLDDSCLEVNGWPADLRGVRAAGEILALVGGNLHPASSPDARGLWRMRVPLASGAATFLMVEQGGLRMALPWASVLAVVMAPNDVIGNAKLGIPVLSRPDAAADLPREIPVVLLAHGLKRAYFAADRLIWRLRAEAVDVDEIPPLVGLVRRLRADDGEEYWQADPDVLLASLEPPPIPEQAFPIPSPPIIEPAPTINGAVTPEIEHAPAQASAPIAPEASTPSSTVTPPVVPTLRTLTPENVEPLLVPEPKPAPSTPPAPPHVAVTPPPVRTREVRPPSPPPTPAAAALRHVLVADDSFIARTFLGRMLEQRGFRVTAVSSAAELFEMLPGQAWDLLCVDVELGDRAGTDLMRQVRDALARLAATETRGTVHVPPVVALVRDGRDIRKARTAGVSLTLLKPFDAVEFEALLSSLEPGDEDES